MATRLQSVAALAACGVIALAVCACGESQSASAGLDLALRVEGAQLVRAPLGADNGGPHVTFVDLRRVSVIAGEGGTPVAGRASAGAYAIHLALDGDGGSWVLPVGVEDVAVPGELTWNARLSFAHLAPLGPTALLVQAVDGAGRRGPVARTALTIADGAPSGDLVISLRWDRQMDLDLHVTTPDGVAIGPKNINTYEPPAPGQPPDAPDAYKDGGIIDVDSNANCLIDGRRREHAVWQSAAPPGRYVVSVDLAATCGLDAPATFVVDAVHGGKVIGAARGVLYPLDARHTAQGGAAPLRVLELSL